MARYLVTLATVLAIGVAATPAFADFNPLRVARDAAELGLNTAKRAVDLGIDTAEDAIGVAEDAVTPDERPCHSGELYRDGDGDWHTCRAH